MNFKEAVKLLLNYFNTDSDEDIKYRKAVNFVDNKVLHKEFKVLVRIGNDEYVLNSYDDIEDAKRNASAYYYSNVVYYNQKESQKCFDDGRYIPKFKKVGYTK